MAITCPRCGSEFDATLFQFGHRVRCRCGAEVVYPGTDLRAGHVLAQGADKATAQALLSDANLNAFSERSWEVWRQGDDGNPFLVKDGLSAKEADDLVPCLKLEGTSSFIGRRRRN